MKVEFVGRGGTISIYRDGFYVFFWAPNESWVFQPKKITYIHIRRII